MEYSRKQFRAFVQKLCTEKYPDSLLFDSVSCLNITYREFLQNVINFGQVFQTENVERGDRIVLIAENSSRFLTVFVSALFYGIVPTIVDKKAKIITIERLFNDSKSRKVFTPERDSSPSVPFVNYSNLIIPNGSVSRGLLFEGESAVADQDMAAYYALTTGTTSEPKVIEISFRNLIGTTLSMGSVYGLVEQDVCLCVLPVHHASGLYRGFFLPLFAGANILLEKSFEKDKFWTIVEKRKVTFAQIVPSIMRVLLQDSSNFRKGMGSTIRYIGSASAPHPQKWVERFESVFNVDVGIAYGMTEATCGIAFREPLGKKYVQGHVGRPLSINKVTIVDDSGVKLPSGKIGRIMVTGANIAVIKTNFLRSDGPVPAEPIQLDTGDLGYLDEAGELWIVGRAEDFIKRGGHRIGITEVEHAINSIAPLLEVVVLPIEHELLGQDIVAVVAGGNGDVSARMLIRELGTVLPSFKIPSRIVMADNIPKKGVGKIDRDAVRQILSGSRPKLVDGVGGD